MGKWLIHYHWVERLIVIGRWRYSSEPYEEGFGTEFDGRIRRQERACGDKIWSL